MSAHDHWPLALHAATVLEGVDCGPQTELSSLCKRLPSFFTREGALVAFSFALSRDGGATYCELLLALLKRRSVSNASSPKAFLQELSQASPERYLTCERALIELSQALRYAAEGLKQGDD